MAFFRFRQNNSRGFFKGYKLVIIEADNAKEANRLVLETTPDVYFEHRSGDCGCCGPRWEPQQDYEEGDESPIYYTGETPYSVHYKPRSMGYGVPAVVEIDPWKD